MSSMVCLVQVAMLPKLGRGTLLITYLVNADWVWDCSKEESCVAYLSVQNAD